MTNNLKLIYRRILLKLSGEVLQGQKRFGIDINEVNRVAQEIKELVELGVQVGIVIGGGNLFRGIELEKSGISRVVSDYVGMLATVINGMVIREALHRIGVNVTLMSTIPINGISDSYNWYEAIGLLKNNYVVIFSAGIGNPFFTTDSAACLRGIEIEAEVVLKATKVDGVFSSDPMKNSNAVLYEQLSYQHVLDKGLKIMDLSAFTLARDHDLPIRVFNINKSGALLRVVIGDKEGTLITR
ncbi:UMP kinase [Sodalis sp. CWE]|uniref:UMP kinase n=1 Tax=Sodalis sp. CWE TaxID=2803816 RepID=UPI001C7CE527|nr:UMP kinase [Sodalis sp. CWE]MBX4180878.1 UMP kinase [Sodalis sp. CWE]